MTLPAPTYDLVLVLDPQAADDARAKIVADARAAISADGELLRHDDWGERPLSYPIRRRASGDYHLMQFHAGQPELLKGLDRNLRIADGILRFRIVRLAPGTPEAPDMRSSAPPARPPAEAAAPAAATAPEAPPLAAPEAEEPASGEAPAPEDAAAPAPEDAAPTPEAAAPAPEETQQGAPAADAADAGMPPAEGAAGEVDVGDDN